MNLLRGRRDVVVRVVCAVVIAGLLAALAWWTTTEPGMFADQLKRDQAFHAVDWDARIESVTFDDAYFSSRGITVRDPSTAMQEHRVPSRDLVALLNRIADAGGRVVVLNASVYRGNVREATDLESVLPDFLAAAKRLDLFLPLARAPKREIAGLDEAVHVHRDWLRGFRWDGNENPIAIRAAESGPDGPRPSMPFEIVRALVRSTGAPDPTPQLPRLVRFGNAWGRDPISATAVLDQPHAPDRFKGKVLFVSAGYPGYTTSSGNAALVPFEAFAVNALLSDPIAYRTSSTTEVVLVSFVLALLTLLSSLFVRPVIAVVANVVLFLTYLILAAGELGEETHQVKIENPSLAAVLAIVIGFALRSFLERRSGDRIRRVVAEYMPPAVALALARTGKAAQTQDPVEATVVFVDVRGYTAMTGRLDAMQVKAALDIYYSVLGPVVADHGGELLYYAGDGMVITFGPPTHPDDHPDRAVACALAMQQARTRVAYELGKRGLPELSYGVGVDTGTVVIGPLGSGVHRQYTVLGEAVNIASRMCAVATEAQVCLTESTRIRLRNAPPLVDLGELQLKNVLRDIQGWRLADDAVVVA